LARLLTLHIITPVKLQQLSSVVYSWAGIVENRNTGIQHTFIKFEQNKKNRFLIKIPDKREKP